MEAALSPYIVRAHIQQSPYFDVVSQGQNDDTAEWLLTLNRQLSGQKVKLHLSGQHVLDIDEFKALLASYKIDIQAAGEDYELTMPEDWTGASLPMTSSFNSGQPADVSVQLTATVDSAPLTAQDALYQYTDIAGEITVDESLKNKAVTVQLMDKSSDRVVTEQQVDAGTFQFKEVRVFNDEGQKIDYGLRVAALPGYHVTTDDFKIDIQQDDKKEDTAETPSTEEIKTEEAATEETSTEEKKTNDVITEETMTEDVTTENATTETPVVETAPKSIVFKPQMRFMNVMTLAATSSTYSSTPSASTINIATGTGILGLSSQMNSNNTSITWRFTLDYETLATKPVWLNDIAVSNGLSMPTSVSYSVVPRTGNIRNGTLPVTTTNGLSSISLGNVNQYDFYVVTIVTPVTTPDLSSYKLTIGRLTYDEIGYKYNRVGISNTITRKTLTPTINTVTEAAGLVTGTAEAGATVTLRNASGVSLGTATADSSGKYSMSISPQAKGSVLTASAQLPNQIASDSVSTTVVGLYSFNVLKVDNNQKPLAGAVFTLSGPTTQQATSNNAGTAQFTALQPGTYTLTETAAPNGYVRNTTSKTVVMASNGAVTVDGTAVSGSYQYVNQPVTSSIRINAVDGLSNKGVAGATYELRNAAGQLVATQTSDSSGVALFNNLPLGSYTVTQVKAPPGYQLNNSSQSVTVTAAQSVFNSPQYSNVLPNTGGHGPIAFTISGIFMMAIAFLFYKIKFIREASHV